MKIKFSCINNIKKFFFLRKLKKIESYTSDINFNIHENIKYPKYKRGKILKKISSRSFFLFINKTEKTKTFELCSLIRSFFKREKTFPEITPLFFCGNRKKLTTLIKKKNLDFRKKILFNFFLERKKKILLKKKKNFIILIIFDTSSITRKIFNFFNGLEIDALRFKIDLRFTSPFHFTKFKRINLLKKNITPFVSDLNFIKKKKNIFRENKLLSKKKEKKLLKNKLINFFFSKSKPLNEKLDKRKKKDINNPKNKKKKNFFI